MLERGKDRILSALMEYKLLKVFVALVGGLLVAVGFQGYSLAFIPSGVLAAAGMLTEVSLVYVYSVSIEKARQEIVEQREEINRLLREVREVSRGVDQAKNEVSDVQREVEQAKSDISSSQREIEDTSSTAQKAKREAEKIKKEIERATRKY